MILNSVTFFGDTPGTKIPLSNYYIINEFKLFKINVFTSTSFYSGTDANVYIIIFDFFKDTGSSGNDLCKDKVFKYIKIIFR